jgi:hypothetical protein
LEFAAEFEGLSRLRRIDAEQTNGLAAERIPVAAHIAAECAI